MAGSDDQTGEPSQESEENAQIQQNEANTPQEPGNSQRPARRPGRPPKPDPPTTPIGKFVFLIRRFIDSVPHPDEVEESDWSIIIAWMQSERSRLKAREEQDWDYSDKAIRRIAWNLRLKHEEARGNYISERRIGGCFSCLGVLIIFGAVSIVVYGYYHLWEHVVPLSSLPEQNGVPDLSGGIIPPDLWEAGIATTGATALLMAIGALLIRVARQHYERGEKHVQEMGETRRTETAIRMALSLPLVKTDLAKSVVVEAAKISLKPVPMNQTAVSDPVTVADLPKKVLEAAKDSIDTIKNAKEALSPKKEE